MQNLLVMMSQQDPVGPLVQDLCTRISCSRSLFQDLCIKISAGPLVEDFLPDCARNCASIPRAKGHTWKLEIATLPAFRAMDTHDHHRGLHFEIRNRNFTSISRDGHGRSPQRVALRIQKNLNQLDQRFVRWTRTTSTEGRASKSEIATLPAFCAMDAHDCRRRLQFETEKRNCTCIPSTRHA